ncbi:MAG: radical SAM enzyme [Monoraphidium minutum]|nr:MAG: radical SAM enzyme [Monoraphidium minutum]
MPPHALHRCRAAGRGLLAQAGAHLRPQRHRRYSGAAGGTPHRPPGLQLRPGRAAAAGAGGAGGAATEPAAEAAGAAGAAGAAAAAGVPPPTSAYVHLPFCKRKCFYCDFPVEAVGGRPGGARAQGRIASYVDLLLREVEATAVLNSPRGAPLETVYFGGGTPSLVPPPLLERILSALRRRFGLAAGAEVTIEADPGTFDAALLAEYRRLGFTRLSVGVQSFEEDLLRSCGRTHTAADAAAALAAAAAAGFPTWSLDVMSGLPGLTRAAWAETLRRAVEAGAPHVSVYDLQVEEGTPFARMYTPGEAPLPPDDAAAEMYREASRVLGAAGYEHYEVSNYARPGHRSRHNQRYWTMQQYYAFGLGAVSYLDGRRYSRPKALPGYEAWVGSFAAAAAAGGPGAGLAGAEAARESKEERLLDALMLGLRTADGVDIASLRMEHGAAALAPALPVLRRHTAAGLVQLRSSGSSSSGGGSGAGPAATAGAGPADGEGEVLSARLADPDGFLFSNDIISDVFAAL